MSKELLTDSLLIDPFLNAKLPDRYGQCHQNGSAEAAHSCGFGERFILSRDIPRYPHKSDTVEETQLVIKTGLWKQHETAQIPNLDKLYYINQFKSLVVDCSGLWYVVVHAGLADHVLYHASQLGKLCAGDCWCFAASTWWRVVPRKWLCNSVFRSRKSLRSSQAEAAEGLIKFKPSSMASWCFLPCLFSVAWFCYVLFSLASSFSTSVDGTVSVKNDQSLLISAGEWERAALRGRMRPDIWRTVDVIEGYREIERECCKDRIERYWWYLDRIGVDGDFEDL